MIDTPTYNAWVIAAVIAVVFIVLAVLFVPRRRSFLRLLPGLFLIVVPVIVLVGGIVSVIAAREEIDLRIRQAAIAAMVVASGWVVSFLLQEYRRADERDERIRDMHRAIYADVTSYLEALESTAVLERQCRDFLKRLAEDATYVPVLSPPRRSQMFTALSGQVHVLPRATIDLIVVFYSQLETTAEFVTNMNTDRFASLSADRRKLAYEDYFAMLRYAFDLGEATQRVITVYDKKGSKAARVLSAQLKASQAVSIPDAVRSGQ
jgi:hypothetical protein